ncbi:MAG: 4-hydroxythreonine-4-phosphate dehydrogenase PdxA [Candidatus Omnitrophota bacterium]|nr:4-hydroxythreonine-4-phosphate dehydrogenase PdxA [Candidatus Omnitrophota bacterium]
MSTVLSSNIVVGITMGDPSGIGPEVIAKAIKKLRLNKRIKLLVIGDRFVLQKFTGKLPANCDILDLKNVRQKKFSFGKINLSYGRAAIDYLEKAVGLIKDKTIDCLVTAPINKKAISLAGFKWIGHTEYLAKEFNLKDFVMMFAADKLKVSLATRHISLKEVPIHLNKEAIFKTICLSSDYLKKYFKIRNPKIGVCGLNPHAGENGLLGKEDNLIIKPAVEMAKRKNKNVSGPYPSDTIFYQAIKGNFDCIVAMYHDQGMIPIKTLFFDRVVNLTLGLPFIRTSPSHGTAFDIAGRNIANPSSMIEAIKLANKLTSTIAK